MTSLKSNSTPTNPFPYRCSLCLAVLFFFVFSAVPVQAQQSAAELEQELERLKRGYHGMTMTFIQFAEEQQVDAYEAGRWTGRFLSRYADETFKPQQFLAWMEDELKLYEVHFAVTEASETAIRASRGRILTPDKLPWLYRYDTTLDEYEQYYHGALVEIARAYGVAYEQRQEGARVLVTIRK